MFLGFMWFCWRSVVCCHTLMRVSRFLLHTLGLLVWQVRAQGQGCSCCHPAFQKKWTCCWLTFIRMSFGPGKLSGAALWFASRLQVVLCAFLSFSGIAIFVMLDRWTGSSHSSVSLSNTFILSVFNQNPGPWSLIQYILKSKPWHYNRDTHHQTSNYRPGTKSAESKTQGPHSKPYTNPEFKPWNSDNQQPHEFSSTDS